MSPRKKEENQKIRHLAAASLLDAALKVFAKQGYHASTMAQIATEAGVSKGLAYHYFASKEELLVSLAERRLQEFTPLVDALEKIDDPYERLLFLVNFALEELVEKTEELRFYNALYLTADGVKAIGKAMEKYKGQFDKLFQAEHQLQVDLGSKNPEIDATFLRSMLQGISLEYQLDPHYPLTQMKKKLLDLFKK